MTQEESMLLSYMAENFDTERIEREGIFVRTTKVHGRGKVGDIAGCNNRGYRLLGINHKLYSIHRLVWLWVNKAFPKKDIDHINGICDDNRIENLRDVTSEINHQNMSMNKRNTSGASGVSPNSTGFGWDVCINKIGGGRFRKYFKIKAEAIACAKAKYIEFGYTQRHGLEKRHG